MAGTYSGTAVASSLAAAHRTVATLLEAGAKYTVPGRFTRMDSRGGRAQRTNSHGGARRARA